MPDKQYYSEIVDRNKDNRNWFSTHEKLPEFNHPVLIRLRHDKLIADEDDRFCYPLEDMKLGKFNPDNGWTIHPPYQKYEFDNLSNHHHILPYVSITHWANATEQDIGNWSTRFKIKGSYEQLSLCVDRHNEEKVYKSLAIAKEFLAIYGGEEVRKEGSPLEQTYYVLCDLQNSIVSTDSKTSQPPEPVMELH